MKTTVKTMDYESVMALPRPKRKAPKRPNLFWRLLIQFLCPFGMMGTGFKYKAELDGLDKDEPCLILMNHTCFLDMEIAHRVLFPRVFNIVASNDGFIGLWGLMEWVMRAIGCIPTQKYVSDLRLVQDMEYCFKTLKTSVLMYPEAGYSFDGTATQLPRRFGILIKKFGVPVVMVETFGAFARNPLYNELQIRKDQKVSARAYVLYTKEQIKSMTVQELSDGVDAAFGFDHFKWQKEQGIEIDEPFRADGLHRILYKCTDCGAEAQMLGKGTTITCAHCGKTWELKTDGQVAAMDGDTKIAHIPDWYRWERERVAEDIMSGEYKLDIDVDIAMQVDYKAVYRVGEGHLTHDNTGFHLTGCDGKLDYCQPPQASYSLYADYYWYEMADCICIGDTDVHYFLFPKNPSIPVAKVRLACEEMFKLHKARKLNKA